MQADRSLFTRQTFVEFPDLRVSGQGLRRREKNSQNMHVCTPPVYMVSMGRMPTQATSAGYLTMMPDVHFRTGSSHSDMLEGVEAATRKAIELGCADPARIGVTGHSYGGEGAAGAPDLKQDEKLEPATPEPAK